MDVITSYHWQLPQVTLCWNRVKGPVISLQHWKLYSKHTIGLRGGQLWHFWLWHWDPLHGTHGKSSKMRDVCEWLKRTKNRSGCNMWDTMSKQMCTRVSHTQAFSWADETFSFAPDMSSFMVIKSCPGDFIKFSKISVFFSACFTDHSYS